MTRKQDKQRLAGRLSDLDGADPAATAKAIRSFYEAALAEAAELFTGTRKGVACSRFLCNAADAGVERLASCLGAAPQGACWLAVGGYGRGLLSPGSAVRVLLLHDEPDPEAARASADAARELIEAAFPRAELTACTVRQAVELMDRDAMTASAFLETRLLGGAKKTHAAWRKAVKDDFLAAAWGTFGERALSESLARRDPHTSSPYSTEINLKESLGTLRDVGTVQKLADALLEVPALERLWPDMGGARSGLMLAQERAALKKALDFLMAVRNQLHFAAGAQSDVLEMRSQPAVAKRLGYEKSGDADAAVAGLMRDLFTHTGRVARLLRTAHERFAHVRAVAWEKPKLLARRRLEDGFVEVQGSVYNALPLASDEAAGRRMMRLFLLSQRRHLPVSQLLLDEIRDALGALGPSFRSDERASALFLELLGGSVGVAERLAWMRDCGLLQNYLPELAPLVNLVSYKEAYDYTLDEHSIEAVRVMDELGHTREETELPQREVLTRVERPDLLRLAVLLHHAGNGDAGAKAVRATCKRMGLPKADVELVAFLVEHQDLLKDMAERRDFEDADAIEAAAQKVGSPERLRKLYLLTYADSRAVGRLAWFAWRDAVLHEAYQKIMAALVPGLEARATPEYFCTRLRQLAAGEGLQEATERFCAILPERYTVEVSPQEGLEHVKLLERLKSAPAAMSVSTEGRCARVWFCTSDVPARFSQIAGVLTASGLNILTAHAFTLEDGTVLDRFLAHKKGQPIGADPAFWAQVEQTLVDSVAGKVDLDAVIAERLTREEPQAGAPARRGVTSVHFDNESSARFTLLDLVTWDRMGLLHSVGSALSEVGANIEFAMASTRLDLAEDVFYINDSKTGAKIESEERLADITRALLKAVSEVG